LKTNFKIPYFQYRVATLHHTRICNALLRHHTRNALLCTVGESFARTKEILNSENNGQSNRCERHFRKRFGNSSYHHPCIAVELQWSCCKLLWSVERKETEKKLRTCFQVY